MKRKILILCDRYPFRNQLINFGDRALSYGLYKLLQKDPDTSIVSGGWKNFPYFNFRKFQAEYKKNQEIEVVFEKWYQSVIKYSQM